MSEARDVPLDAARLRRSFAHFPSGVVAVCAQVEGRPHGLLVSTFVPVSLDPPLVSFCVQLNSTTWPRLSSARRLGLSLLGSEQEAAAKALGARDGDRFRDVDVQRGRGEAVLVAGASAWVEGSVDTEVTAGDHIVVLLRVAHLSTRAEVEPLVFHSSRFRRLVTHRSPVDRPALTN